jgi:predicted dinucleotide-binding enzyme
MKITVLGTGMVGQAICSKLAQLGHEVYMGTRDPKETKKRTEPNQMTGISFHDWYQQNKKVKLVKFHDFPNDSEIIVNALNGESTMEALKEIGSDLLYSKVILDISNGLDFSKGMPPTLTVCNDDSLGEQIQNAFPESHVVKSLNTINCDIMVDPSRIPGNHVVFTCGNNMEAKSKVVDLLNEFGWKDNNIIDLGDISNARGTEMLIPLWMRVWGSIGSPHFNFNIVTS